jgi:predicted CopG family antitoxin
LRYFDEAIQVAEDILGKLGEEESGADEFKEVITEIQKLKETGLDFKVRRAAGLLVAGASAPETVAIKEKDTASAERAPTPSGQGGKATKGHKIDKNAEV